MSIPILFIGSPIGPLSGPSRGGGPKALFLFPDGCFREAPPTSVRPRGESATACYSIYSVGAGFLVDTNNIAQMIEPSLAAMGYRLVRVLITGGRRATLQVMAERLDDLRIPHHCF